MNMWKIIMAVFCALGLGQPVLQAQPSYRTPFSNQLEVMLSQDTGKHGSSWLDRLHAMRFYRSSNQVQPKPHWWQTLFNGKSTQQQQEYAVALYLFNMYVSTAVYQEDVPAQLTLDYLGVLDGFSKCRDMFALSQVETFYNKHYYTIKAHLAEFFKEAGLPDYSVSDLKNDEREHAFLKLLTTTPSRNRRPGYKWEGSTRLTTTIYPQERQWVARMISDNLAAGENKVITYKVPRMQMENLDNPLATPKHSVDRLYRCVNDECAYCSYLLGKNFCQKVGSSYLQRENMRLYKITAYPTKGEFLTPVQGERFTLANGGQASNWYYHTAILVILNLNGHYTPLVSDTFLGGDEPVSLEEWTQYFAPKKTYFQVDVFERKQVIEEAIVEPSARKGDNVLIDGVIYRPYDVLP